MPPILGKISSYFETSLNKVQKFELNDSSSSLNDVFNLIESQNLKNSNKTIFFVKSRIEKRFGPQDLNKFNKTCSNLSIAVLLTSKSFSKISLFWKLSKQKSFLFLKPLCGKYSEDDNEIYEFIANVIVESLKTRHLGLEKSYELDENISFVDVFQIADSEGSNLLSIAKTSRNTYVENRLLSMKMYLLDENRGPHLQTLAVKYGHFDVILNLYEEDIPILKSDELKIGSKEVENFMQMLADFNQMIIKDDVKRVEEIFNQLPKARYYLSLKNESALKVATLNSSFKTYEFLWSHGIRFAPHESPDELYDELPYGQNKIREIHDKYTQELQERHISILISRSVLFDDSQNIQIKLELVQKAYLILNSNPLIKVILMVVAASRKFKITFDFNNEGLNILDPTVDSSHQGKFVETGRIYIAAKPLLDSSRENETLGNLAHELCHFAVHLVYRNKAKPYFQNDKNTMEKLENILRKCEKTKHIEDVIRHLFGYAKSKLHAELIVRVVHMLALYRNQPEKLAGLRNIYSELFIFYETKIVPEMMNAIPEVTRRGAIISKEVYNFKDLSNDDQKKVQSSLVNYKDVKLQMQELFPQNLEIYEILTSDHLLLLLDDQILSFTSPHTNYLNEQVRHSWKNLTTKLKDKILKSKFTFQNVYLKYSDLHEKCSKSFELLTSDQIIDILSDKNQIIGKIIENQSTFYVERIFWDYNFFQKYKKSDTIYLDILPFYETNREIQSFQILPTFLDNFDKVLAKAEMLRMFILSDEAGTGKTTTFENFTLRIKQKLPNRWVSYIDLKDFTKFFNNIESLDNIENFFENILDLNSKSAFEKKIFSELFNSDQVVLLYNGFDEISPTYSDFVLTLLDKIYTNTKNIQFLCTRPLYTNMLRQKFNIDPYILAPFDKEKQIEFLRKFFISIKIEENKIEKFIEKVYKIIEKLNEKSQIEQAETKNGEDINTPLVLAMFAELIAYNVEIYESENLWEIYEKFIIRKIDIWDGKSNFAREFNKKLNFEYEDFKTMRMYQMYALKSEMSKYPLRTQIISKKLKIMRQWIPEKLTGDEISRMGILYINGPREFKFAHKTFSEFLCAKFFIDNIYTSKDVDSEDIVLIIQLFIDVFKDFTFKQVMIPKFIMSFFQTKKAQNSGNFHPRILKMFETKFRSIFFDLLTTQNPNNSKVAEFLFNFFKRNQKLLAKLLRVNENETLYTAAPNHESLKELAKSNLNDNDFEKFMNGRNQKGRNLFYFFRDLTRQFFGNSPFVAQEFRIDDDFHALEFELSNLGSEMLESKDTIDLFEFIVSRLSEQEIKEFFLFKPRSNNLSYLGCISDERFWIIIHKVLTQEDQKLFLSNLLYESVRFSYYPDAIPTLLQKIKNTLSNSDIFEIFMSRNILHLSAAHRTFSKFPELWTFFKSHTSENQQKEILQHEITGECLNEKYEVCENCNHFPSFNVFQILLTFPESDSLKHIDMIEKHFTSQELQNCIMKSNNYIPYLIGQSSVKYCENFINFLKQICDGNVNLIKDFIRSEIEPTELDLFVVMHDKPDLLEPFRNIN